MCNFFSALVTRDGCVVWDANETSHEKLVAKAGVKDDKLVDRDFVRVELKPSGAQLFDDPKTWSFKVDEKGTLPAWFNEKKARVETVEAAKACLKPLAKNFQKVKAFVKELPELKWCKPDGKPKKEWKLFVAPTLNAAEDAAWDAAWVTAGDAIRDAAWVTAGDAVRDAAWVTAWDAIRDAAEDVAEDVAEDAARDAALYAYCLLVKGKVDAKHFKHAEARMEVWRKGYCLRCDVNGVLYVYAVEPAKSKEAKV